MDAGLIALFDKADSEKEREREGMMNGMKAAIARRRLLCVFIARESQRAAVVGFGMKTSTSSSEVEMLKMGA